MASVAAMLKPQEVGLPVLPHCPENEALRMDTIRALRIDGDSFPPDPMLNAMCKTIAKLLSVPIAGISVVQDKQLHMRAAAGLPEDFCCGRDGAFCSWTLLPRNPEVLVIEDTIKDARFSTLDHVKGPDGLRFYAGAPLLASNGTRLGAVCIFDTKPRKMRAEDLNVLTNFSEIAIRRLEEREFKKLKRNASGKLNRCESDLSQPVVLCDVTANRWWSLLYCNEAFTQCTGVSVDASSAGESNFWKLFKPAQAKSKIQDDFEDDIRAGKEIVVTVMRRDSSNKHAFEMQFRPATTANLSGHASAISVPNIVAATEIGEAGSNYYFATVKEVEQLTALRLTDTQVGSAEPAKQATFVGVGEGSAGGGDGMRDVTMGVLCSNSPDGLVYRARWRKKSVSVRVIEAKLSECSIFPEFGEHAVPMEAAVSLKLSHPNIVTTHKIVVEDSPNASETARKLVLVWMVREWCGRGTLTDALQRGWLRTTDGRPNLAACLAAALEVAAALAYVHSDGIVHGDVTPDSVLLQDDKDRTAGKHKDFVAKLTDFALSTRVDSLTAPPKMGAASHAAPELLSKGTKTTATDVYAYGMLLWELYMGQVVWPSLNFSQLHRRVVAAKEKPPMPSDMPVGLRDLIESCLDNTPGGRPDMEEVVESIRRLAREEAAGQLVYALAVPPERRGPKLFRMESKKEREERKMVTASLPSEDLKRPPLARLPSRRDSAKPKQDSNPPPTTKSLFKRLMPGVK